jgi:sigma-E factor negative regulatory protein RseC
MSNIGEVIKRDGDRVTVTLRRHAACEGCGACAAANRRILITAYNLCGADTGDAVEVELNRSSFLKVTLVLYGLPFCSLALGFVFGYIVFNAASLPQKAAEPAAFITGLVCLAVCFLIIKGMEKKSRFLKHMPAAVRKIEE